MSDLLAREGFKVSRNVVRKLLKNNGYVKAQTVKKIKRVADMWIVILNLSVLPN
ncbi:hypothetical protein [Bathymodiolus platifrons methanotrophic gill symbiont]|uniref:hypothetical protein n=1 Tax=Bathymodiolus platifrons methanotrophic gill symbiont TaxID=113268 RepID=UPI001E5B1F25|nr:hypothetical protein [Bathymodiolus platifrons methanotrophic gill symbiont]